MRRAGLRERPVPAAARFHAQAGRSIDRSTRALMERRFGADFGAVRLHTDEAAARTARSLSANAFTTGPHVVFGAGQPRPESEPGRALLAHELSHVVQQRHGVERPAAVSHPGDVDERVAERSVERIAAGHAPQIDRPAAAGIQREPAGRQALFPQTLLIQSQAETVMESFLNRMWDAQSKQQKPLRLTPKLIEGLNHVFTMGAPLGAQTDYKDPRALLDVLRPHLPQTIDPQVTKVLDGLARSETVLPGNRFKGDADPAEPRFETPDGKPGDQAADTPPKLGKADDKDKAASDAAMAALKAAAETFRKTPLGQELEKRGKDYVLSKEGIPLVVIVAAGVLTFVAASDSIPSLPEFSIGEGIKLKVDISAKPSELPPLLREMAHDTRGDAQQPERKVGVQVSFTWEALASFAKATGHFFAEAATAIGKGIVKAGTVIGQAAARSWDILLGGIGGAAVGAVAGGGLGAAIGAGVGALVGLGVGLGVHFLRHRDRKKAP